ncbi:hypothetical protein H696_02008 [Fonticula alba]|uniref:DUF1640 domain-containing protein n=1 Tax=Fonticula alba TaxID=691883 RepID=A0A058ZAW0_FONAL|nr:hypothetical protein H696_02008 [Fonticula alba]KCV71058.1 hypothetical protein H696_02008 [Fonticula alba]|eukprot:XP_009494181.1 hypothetical protein H696_02008 [Fonticula alba]
MAAVSIERASKKQPSIAAGAPAGPAPKPADAPSTASAPPTQPSPTVVAQSLPQHMRPPLLGYMPPPGAPRMPMAAATFTPGHGHPSGPGGGPPAGAMHPGIGTYQPPFGLPPYSYTATGTFGGPAAAAAAMHDPGPRDPAAPHHQHHQQHQPPVGAGDAGFPPASAIADPVSHHLFRESLMAAPFSLDTVKIVQSLEDAGLTKAQAESVMRLLQDTMMESIRSLESRLVSRVQHIQHAQAARAELSDMHADLLNVASTTDAEVRSEVEKLQNEIDRSRGFIRDELGRLHNVVSLSLTTDHDRFANELNVNSRRVKELDNRIDVELANLHRQMESTKFDLIKIIFGSLFSLIMLAFGYWRMAVLMKGGKKSGGGGTTQIVMPPPSTPPPAAGSSAATALLPGGPDSGVALA